MGRLLVFVLGLALAVLGGVIFAEFLAAMSVGAPHALRPSPIEFIRPVAALASGLLGLALVFAAIVTHRRKRAEPASATRPETVEEALDMAEPAPFPTPSEPVAEPPEPAMPPPDPAPFPSDETVRAFDPEPITDDDDAPVEPESEPRA